MNSPPRSEDKGLEPLAHVKGADDGKPRAELGKTIASCLVDMQWGADHGDEQ